MNVLKSPILWAVIGISLLIFGFMTSDETKYPTMSKFSAWIIIAGGILVGFSSAYMLNWKPLNQLSIG